MSTQSRAQAAVVWEWDWCLLWGYRIWHSRGVPFESMGARLAIILHTDGLNCSALPWHQCPRTLPQPLQMWGSFSSQSWLCQRNTPPRVHPHSQSNRWPSGRAKRSKRRNKGRALSLPPSWIFPEGRVTHWYMVTSWWHHTRRAYDRVMASMKLQLSEVYDIARKVGEEFQRIIGEFGGRCVATLVPTVVEALEYLEIYVEEYQTLQTRNYKLLLENDSLAMEREQRIRLATENEVSKRCKIYGVWMYVCMYTYTPLYIIPPYQPRPSGLLIEFLPGTATHAIGIFW